MLWLSHTATTANGEGASRSASISAEFAASHSRRILVKYGKLARIKGRLLDRDGRSIKNAELSVQSKTTLSRAKWRPVGTVTTDSKGRFTYLAPVGPSRTLRIAYRAYKNDTAYSDVTDVELGVRAGARLSANRHRIRNGQIVKFTGRLRGGPFPKGRGEIHKNNS